MTNRTVKTGTKGETLQRLRPLLTEGSVPPLRVFTVEEWRRDPQQVIDEVVHNLCTESWESTSSTLIVRSSARGEDSARESMAGAFLSVAGVPQGDTQMLCRSIDEVIGSYGRMSPHDQFIVQLQVEHIAYAGVVFTRDIDTLAPYYIINYDQSSSHDGVTSGGAANLITYVRSKSTPYAAPRVEIEQICTSAAELEHLLECDHLDIEFAIDERGQLWVLQARPIVTAGKTVPCLDEQYERLLTKIQKKAAKLNAPHPGLYGKRGIYSVMTDWNPAEMIGIRPTMLALTLYKELITDGTWAYQRHNYGYKDLRSFPLLVSFMGQPYIDVRVSFNSFVPGDLDDRLSHKLVDYYTEALAAHPTDHDKVEFNIVYSCYYLNLNERLQKLCAHGFSPLELDRIKFGLLNLTNNILSPTTGRYREDLLKVRKLQGRFEEVMGSELPALEKVYWLIEDCKRYGTLPFAGLARAGFIAVQLLTSLVELSILTSEESLAFMNSLNTVAKQLSSDFAAFSAGKISRHEILQRYGHLRPGTYDINSPRYDEAFESYFQDLSNYKEQEHTAPFELRPDQRESIARHLSDNGLVVSVDELMTFIREAIEGRELGKFLFTKSLSEVLKLIEEVGQRNGIAREECGHINLETIRQLYSVLTPDDVAGVLRRDIELNRRGYELAAGVRLPQLITSDRDIYEFFVGEVEPNYVTRGRVTEVVVLEEDMMRCDLSQKIIFLRGADPGYDWLFSRRIGGLITMYGGANSHMAIRCAELQIPAVIGCGEQNFAQWSKAQVLDVDCANRRVTVVSAR